MAFVSVACGARPRHGGESPATRSSGLIPRPLLDALGPLLDKPGCFVYGSNRSVLAEAEEPGAGTVADERGRATRSTRRTAVGEVWSGNWRPRAGLTSTISAWKLTVSGLDIALSGLHDRTRPPQVPRRVLRLRRVQIVGSVDERTRLVEQRAERIEQRAEGISRCDRVAGFHPPCLGGAPASDLTNAMSRCRPESGGDRDLQHAQRASAGGSTGTVPA